MFTNVNLVTSQLYITVLLRERQTLFCCFIIINTKLDDRLLFGNGAHTASPKDWTQEREAEIKYNLTNTVQWSVIKS